MKLDNFNRLHKNKFINKTDFDEPVDKVSLGNKEFKQKPCLLLQEFYKKLRLTSVKTSPGDHGPSHNVAGLNRWLPS